MAEKKVPYPDTGDVSTDMETTSESEVRIYKLEKTAEKIDSKTPFIETFKATSVPCLKCNATIKLTKGRHCRRCGNYYPKPGETIDVSKISFDVSALAPRPPIRTPRPRDLRSDESRHDVACPDVGGDVATHHKTNEWVLNHLPLTEEQKKNLVDDMTKNLETDLTISEDKKKVERLTEVVKDRYERREMIKAQRKKEKKARKLNLVSSRKARTRLPDVNEEEDISKGYPLFTEKPDQDVGHSISTLESTRGV